MAVFALYAEYFLSLWSKETCAPRLQEEWSPQNPTLGQCSITAFLVQDLFGGEVYGVLRPGGNYHCYNVIDGVAIDLTSAQFLDEVLCYEDNPIQERTVHFAKEEKKARYERLRQKLLFKVTEKPIDKAHAKKVFADYTALFDMQDVKIRLKVDHTERVADFAKQIAQSLGADTDFAWMLGLLHDIGRFEQLKQYGTFKDAESVDHAELGADILFVKGKIDEFFPADTAWAFLQNERAAGKVMPDWKTVTEQAIRFHNKLTVPDDFDEVTALYARILRDADKVDIFRVLTEPPYDDRNARIAEGARAGTIAPARDEGMVCVREHRCVPRTFRQTDFENLMAQCCMAFELEFPKSRELVHAQGYLDALLHLELADESLQAQLDEIKLELEHTKE